MGLPSVPVLGLTGTTPLGMLRAFGQQGFARLLGWMYLKFLQHGDCNHIFKRCGSGRWKSLRSFGPLTQAGKTSRGQTLA